MFLRTQKQLLARIQVSVAGLVAEEIWFGQSTSGPSTDLVNATRTAAAYVGLFGMGKSLVSVGAMSPTALDGDPIRAVLADPERRQEVDAILNDCRGRVRALLLQKRPVVEGIRDALLARDELIGDEIEALMAELGEREPLEVPVGVFAGDGSSGRPLALPDGNGRSGNGRGSSDPPPRPDRP
jgi:ATP-dependent Zn protease